ncbi:NAD(P)-binding protein [Aspergillus fijiensis CBS 313.89]|uniref:NAD(P)-binding protein n=1 Tax=Aspergillus fijiensis CBS 313.89 TaxID=1448319 RepID=A0A8G1VWD5_9EURO|nr:NAD(P)-binding protein [Aspergillus fijiensis CBS 313.89]RAK75465.1 NAD(P)-binding protein [Aspergillus fijiensis CBS 313.89]
MDYYNTPAAAPPPGVVPNFVNPPSQRTTIIVLQSIFLFLALLAVSARVWVRTSIIKFWGAEDTTCILAACGSIAHMTLYTQTLPLGIGRHMWDVRAINLIDPSSTRVLDAGGITFPWTVCFAKISILLLYKRVFPLHREIVAVWIGIVADAVLYTFCIAVAIGSLVQCAELSQLEAPYCKFTSGTMITIQSVINVVTDFYVLLLPIPRLLKLQVSRRRRIGLLVTFMSGLGACAASLARLVNFQLNDSSDVFWTTGRNAQFTIVEMNIAIIVACATSFPMCFARLRSLTSSFYNSAVSLLQSGSRETPKNWERLKNGKGDGRMDSQELDPVLVTGGNGFIAYHIIAKILESEPECTIHCIDVNTQRNRHAGANVHYHQGDMANAADVQRIMQLARPATIFHTASPEFSDEPESAYRGIIVDGTHHLLDAAWAVGTVRALVNTSTSGVINDNHTDLVDATEELPILRPPVQQRLYCIAKADAEDAIQAANRTAAPTSAAGTDDRGILTCAIRPALAFGERDHGTLGKMYAVARQGKLRFQMGDGRNLYDFVYVGNLADAHLLAARALLAAWGKPAPAERRVDGECFHITNEEPWLFWDFQREVSRLVGRPVRKEDVVVIPKWVGLTIGFVNEWVAWVVSRGTKKANMTREGIRFSTLVRTLNGGKARRVLGYSPRIGVREGLERSVRWFVENEGGAVEGEKED